MQIFNGFLSCLSTQVLFSGIETDSSAHVAHSAHSVNYDPPRKDFVASILNTTTDIVANIKVGFDDFCQTLSTFCHDTKEAALIGFATVIVATEVIYDPPAVAKVPEKTQAVRDNFREMGKYYDEHEGQIKCAAAFVAAAAVVTVSIICLPGSEAAVGEVLAETAGYGTSALVVAPIKAYKYQKESSIEKNKGAKPREKASEPTVQERRRAEWRNLAFIQF